ncbi:hypothetical protein, partial [Streptomyces flaveolus]|uniref:hypothetical protein n=1 Tax=Streptomyces flaveolus TaxID=67297 RepID=UPI0033D81E83
GADAGQLRQPLAALDDLGLQSLMGEPEEIVVCVAEGHAVVIGTPSGAKGSRWGRWVADLTLSEWAALARTLDPALRSFIEARRLTSHLVEIDQVSRKMMETGKVIIEQGGWIQSSIRNNRGQATRLLRVRPATAVSALSGGAAVLGAIATQTQAAEMARDVKAIRQRVDELSQRLKSDQIGAVENVVGQVEDLVARLRTHGDRGVEASDFSVIRDSLGNVRCKEMRQLQDSVARLENAGQGSLRRAQKGLSEEALEEVMLHLDLMTQCYVATVQFGLALIAFDYHGGKPDVAKTRSEQITKSVSGVRVEIEDVHARLGWLDEAVRALFRSPKRMNVLSSASTAITNATSAAVRQAAGKSVRVGQLHGKSVSLPAAPFALGVGVLALGGFEAITQVQAEKELEGRLRKLAGAGDRSSQTLHQAAPNLGMLRNLAEELSGPAREFTSSHGKR